MNSPSKWHLSSEFFYDGIWQQQRIDGYALVIEGKRKRPNLSITYSPIHHAYECPNCAAFYDKKVDSVSRHALHCGHPATAGNGEQRGWWSHAASPA